MTGRFLRAASIEEEARSFVASPPPEGGDVVLKPWALRQFEELARVLSPEFGSEARLSALALRVEELEAAVAALALRVEDLEAAVAALEAAVGDGTWDG